MSRCYRVYFEGWYGGIYAKAEDWYRDGWIFIDLKYYRHGDALSRPTREQFFLAQVDAPERLEHYADSIVSNLWQYSDTGNLARITIKLPEIDLTDCVTDNKERKFRYAIY